MSFPIFKLRIFNRAIGQEIIEDEDLDGIMMGYPRYREITGINKTEIEFIRACVTNNFINRDWIPFFEWYIRFHRKELLIIRLFRGDAFLYRGIDPRFYKNLIKFGNERGNIKDQYDDAALEPLNLPQSRTIYGTPIFKVAMKYGVQKLKHTFIRIKSFMIAVYRTKYLTRLPYGDGRIYTPTDPSMNFDEILYAVMIIIFDY